MAETTYVYAVSAVDAAGNESPAGSSVEISIPAAPPAEVISVGALSTRVVTAGSRNFRAIAEILVVDSGGSPVSGVLVSGVFSGGVSGAASATTDSRGVAVVESPRRRGTFQATFCIQSLSAAGYVYDPGEDVATCAASP